MRLRSVSWALVKLGPSTLNARCRIAIVWRPAGARTRTGWGRERSMYSRLRLQRETFPRRSREAVLDRAPRNTTWLPLVDLTPRAPRGQCLGSQTSGPLHRSYLSLLAVVPYTAPDPDDARNKARRRSNESLLPSSTAQPIAGRVRESLTLGCENKAQGVEVPFAIFVDSRTLVSRVSKVVLGLEFDGEEIHVQLA